MNVPAVTRAHVHSQTRYALYGLHIESEVPLIQSRACDGYPPGVDLTVRRVDAPPPPPSEGHRPVAAPHCAPGWGIAQYRGTDGTWLTFPSIGTFHISLDLQHVDVYVDAGADEQLVRLAVTGPILLFVRQMRGLPTLHASAVTAGSGAIGFLGPRGAGKSTMAACFLTRGASLVTDDALPLVIEGEVTCAEPGPAHMKLWDEAIQQTLHLQDDLPTVTTHADKKLVEMQGRYPVVQDRVRLRALYLLHRYDPAASGTSEISVRRLSARETLLVAIAHTSSRPFLIPADDAKLLAVYQQIATHLPLYLFSYPTGFANQEAIHARILETLEAA